MNSSVQCLAHTVPLMRVFLRNAYKVDLNRDNPLGNKGELAEAFGALMEKLWQVCTASGRQLLSCSGILTHLFVSCAG